MFCLLTNAFTSSLPSTAKENDRAHKNLCDLTPLVNMQRNASPKFSLQILYHPTNLSIYSRVMINDTHTNKDTLTTSDHHTYSPVLDFNTLTLHKTLYMVAGYDFSKQ